MMEKEEDEFWKLALMSGEDRKLSSHSGDDNDESGNEAADTGSLSRLKTYSLPNGITLEVSSLAENDGVMSPLGAQAWHASSLLACYIILHQDTLFADMDKNHGLHCLELGSGAVGIAGMTLATVLSDICPANCASVLLTDLASEEGILDTLAQNVSRNKNLFSNVNVRVDPLNWNDFRNSETVPSMPLLDLVVGSELVYTEETAVACAAVVTRLLRDNPKLLALIIQVTDRPGFETHFLPLLKGFDVRVEQPFDCDLHETASRIVEFGGTLDRFAYGACWIRSKDR